MPSSATKFKFYAFQQEDIDKLIDQPYALIGSEMGTGKTHEGIELAFQWWKQTVEDAQISLPILVICPIDVMQSWADKFAVQYPMLTVEIINRTNRELFKDSLLDQNSDVYIMHWAAVNLLTDWFVDNKINFSVIVADEVHKIANRNSQTSKNLKRIKCYGRLGLSGTPSGDKPWNLWSILNWLDKKKFSSFWKFVDTFVEEEYDYRTVNGRTDKYRVFKRAKNIAYLHDIIRPFYVRHLKMDRCCKHHPKGVMPYLPAKVYEHHFVELSTQQKRVYKEMEKEMVAWLDDGTPLVAPVIVAQLTRLSQIALATPIINTEEIVDKYGDTVTTTSVELTMPSTKFDLLKEIITNEENEDKQFVIFTSSKRMAYLTSTALNNLNISNRVLSGDTNPHERKKLAPAFNASEFRIFIAVIAAAAEGIDGLQHSSADAIFLDRHRSAIKNQQAEDRLHRGGQQRVVTIHDIIAKDTIDELWVLQKLPEKWRRIKEVIDL